jgi:hypothetical protein
MNKTSIAIWVILLIIIAGLILTFFFKNNQVENLPNQSDNTGEGTTTSGISENNLIQITNPSRDALVLSPLTIVGEARGAWYFEAQFPIKIVDSNGVLLGSTAGHAESDWMTNNFVPFQALLTFDSPTTATGTLILEKDNPSGLPGNADSISIPVRFKGSQ